VYELDRMLTLVTTHGTGRNAITHLPRGTVVAGKTGTSSDTRDSWFAGFTGSYLAVVWVGYDDNRPTGLTGAAAGLPVWGDTLAHLKSASFEPVPPEGIEDRWIGFHDGFETTPSCSADAVAIAVPAGTVLPLKPGCSSLASASSPPRNASPRNSVPASPPTASPQRTAPTGTVTDKVKAWFKDIIH
jgi:penicillin-binding protein 1B